jgi:hypothetical protein
MRRAQFVSSRVRNTLALCAAACVWMISSAAPASAAKGEKLLDLFWTTPDSTALAEVESIAQLPVATYDNVIEHEKVVENAWAQLFRRSGYRWLSATTSRNLLRSGAEGDSVSKAVREMILADGRVDSVAAASVCARLRVRALLCVRVDQWQQVKIEPTDSGKPSTSIRLRAALVDSLGRLLWTASGGEFAEGPYQQAVPQPPGAQALVHGDIGQKQVGGPPDPLEVLTTLFTRWVPHFPAHVRPSGDR